MLCIHIWIRSTRHVYFEMGGAISNLIIIKLGICYPSACYCFWFSSRICGCWITPRFVLIWPTKITLDVPSLFTCIHCSGCVCVWGHFRSAVLIGANLPSSAPPPPSHLKLHSPLPFLLLTFSLSLSRYFPKLRFTRSIG